MRSQVHTSYQGFYLNVTCAHRGKSKEKDSAPPAAPTPPDPYRDAYSTVDECASVLPRATFDHSVSVSPDGPASQGGPSLTVESDLYADPTEALPDISPYACFYGAPQLQMLKVGWLDKLSPQG